MDLLSFKKIPIAEIKMGNLKNNIQYREIEN
jgi:hypothetical protein